MNLTEASKICKNPNFYSRKIIKKTFLWLHKRADEHANSHTYASAARSAELRNRARNLLKHVGSFD